MQQQRQKKVPVRRCVGCNAQRPKRELVRIVRSPEAVSYTHLDVYKRQGDPTNIKGGAKLTRAQLMEKGLNDSAIHEDVMIGAPDTRITGVRKNGEEVVIFENGEWAF